MIISNQPHKILNEITSDIIIRSATTRNAYLARMRNKFGVKIKRSELSCTNLAHVMAASNPSDKIILRQIQNPDIAIVSAYNDILSAHQPYVNYPEQIKQIATQMGAVAQFACGVPAMCDGITQGQIGMELSLFSREVIAMSTAVGLSHNIFDGVICLGICDKIVPGLLIGALSFGYLPTIFIPSGPMPSGISNSQKAKIRQDYANNLISKEELLLSEMQSYHSSGTCTFYGTANSNQMLMEIMGLHLPGSSFIQPNTQLRTYLTQDAVKQLINITTKDNFTPLCNIISEKTIVNAMIGLIATGGSTNHTLHLPAIAKAAGIIINWNDFAKLSKIIPLLAKVYPNGDADINAFYQAGGTSYIIRELLNNGLLHNDVTTVVGNELSLYTKNPELNAPLINKDHDKYNTHNNVDNIIWKTADNNNTQILRDVTNPFEDEGGIRLVAGNIGRAIAKVSAIERKYRYIKAKAIVFHSQDDVIQAFHDHKLNQDCIVVLCYQGAKANGMPELHGLMPILSSLQSNNYKIALITDGRMSGASGKIPHAIHMDYEAALGGNIAKICDGDIIELDLNNGTLNLMIDDITLTKRAVTANKYHNWHTYDAGRELFAIFRNNVSLAEHGATIFAN